ncbi:S-adenosyl-L-methionine-dependent methyltransferase [Podospora australis]|uniref:S-adenosyl-L-methionine-dependent methyltransferase n=1 Tax=Podospora australis TaxID=1536484 RepID=A0AAN6X2A9_9PEZI|nr:S-adenosyl-L-methionine-dependent methyltransferase [Podospora australis]
MAPKSSSQSSSQGKKKSSSSSSSQKQIPVIDPNSSFTPGSFERELKDLAAKARAETPGKHFQEQAIIYLKSALLLSLIAVFSKVSQLALSPTYGSIPASKWHNKVLTAACFVGWSTNLQLNRILPFKAEKLLPVLAVYAPVVQYFLGEFSQSLTQEWGPLVAELLTLFPIVTISAGCVATYLDGAELGWLPKWLVDAAPGLGSYGYFKAAESYFGQFIDEHIGTKLLNSRVGLEVVLAASYSAFAPSKLLALAVPALLHTALFNTHLPTSYALGRLNSGLEKHGYVVLDRQESLTGYISVVDSPKEGYRVLRCDHSLLGGEWVKFIGQPQFQGNQVAEPIYGVFAMLEAVRLVETPKPIKDNKAKALVIGLGIGTTPAALVAHGIDTTVVEIDPVVHKFASKYFQLPSNHTAVIEDAVTYTSRMASNGSETRYDYIIHDVFTGGAEPIPLFTLEFLENLNTLLKPNGVIAINYAGDFALPPPRIITQTIHTVFPSCRAFREHPRDPEDFEKNGRDFTNMVIFCTKQVSASGKTNKIKFRRPTERDLLNSPSRQHFLYPQHEVKDEDFVKAEGEAEGILKANDSDRLKKWHEQSAAGHWAIMRTVLPKEVWEAW